MVIQKKEMVRKNRIIMVIDLEVESYQIKKIKKRLKKTDIEAYGLIISLEEIIEKEKTLTILAKNKIIELTDEIEELKRDSRF
jgi:hypothetical protein